MEGSKAEITQLASQWSNGDESAFDRLIELVYDDLRRIAHHHLGMGAPDTVINTTVLVHEAYVKLAGADEATWPSRAHFFAFCSKAMRRILIDRARARGALKRGGSARHLTLDPATLSLDSIPAEVADLDEALTRFEAEDPQKAALVKLRFYGGLTLKQAAAALGLAPATADRHWAYARAWLFQALSVEESKFSDSQ